MRTESEGVGNAEQSNGEKKRRRGGGRIMLTHRQINGEDENMAGWGGER